MHSYETFEVITTFQDVHTVRLRLRKPDSKKKVQWQSGTVDNEHMNKKKSKCEYVLYIFMFDNE